MICNKSSNQASTKGFTLLELLMALSILVSTLIIGASFINKKDNVIKKTFRQFVALNRQLDHFARLKRKTWRLVIQMDEKTSSWWVEKQLSKNQMPNVDQSADSEKTPPLPGEFVIDTDFFEKPQKLPGKLHFESVELQHQKELVTNGKAYIYYFPEGQFSKAILKIKGKKMYWSLFIDRLRGDLIVFRGEKKLEDFSQ